MAYNTGNPVESTDPRDFKDNAVILDRIINSTDETINNRLGEPVRTLAGLAVMATGVPAVEASIAAREAQSAAESAAAAAALSSGIYPDTATALADGSLDDGKYFSVPSVEDDEYLILYRKLSGVATEIKRYRTSPQVLEFPTTDDDEVFAIPDINGRKALSILKSGKVVLPFAALSNADFLTGPETVDGISIAIVDSSNRMALYVTGTGEAVMPGFTAEFDDAEIIAARGERATLDTRISQALNGYGLPIRHTWGEWYLRETRQRLRKLDLGESAQLVVASIGDSWTHNRERWTKPTANSLIAEYGDAGPGWTGFADLTGALLNGNVDSSRVGVTFSGTWNKASGYYNTASPDLGRAYSSAAGSRITVTGPAGCSAVRLFYIAGSAALRYRWDAGTWVDLDLSGSGTLIADLASVPSTAWTLDLEVVSGTVSLCGCDIQMTSDGVRWHKLGATGSRTAQWVAVNDAQWSGAFAQLAPNLVVIMHGTNDQDQYPAATYGANLTELISRVRDAVPLADVLLIAPCENGRSNTIPMAEYADEMYRVAQQQRCAFMDLQYLFGDEFSQYASTSPRNWFNADLIHPEPSTGGRVIADAAIRLITKS